jgi:prepilin-type N-terminal cleavage/methylation domain-containing protein
MSMTTRTRRADAGFTLVELLVVMTLLSVIGGVVVSSLVTSMQSTRDTQTRVEAMAQLQRAAENVTREIRAACPIVGTSLDKDRITAAIQRDGERLRHTYRLDAAAGTLVQDVQQENAAGSWVTLISGRVIISDLVADKSGFEFFDDASGAVTLPGDVRMVKVNLSRSLPDAGDVFVETAVSLRNGGRSCD